MIYLTTSEIEKPPGASENAPFVVNEVFGCCNCCIPLPNEHLSLRDCFVPRNDKLE
jgi:hypothetical protein